MCPPGGVSKSRGGGFVDLTFPAFPLTPSCNGSLSTAEASLCRGEAGERKKESAQDTMGIRAKREERPQAPAFSFFPSCPALFIFPLLLFLLGYPAGASAEERASGSKPISPDQEKANLLLSIFCWSHYLVLLPILKMLL